MTSATPTVVSQATRESGIAVLWRLEMSPALSPELALDYLRELSPSVVRCALLDKGGRLLAGDPGLVAFAGEAPIAPAATGAPAPVVARDAGAVLVALTGGFTPRALVELDVRLAIAAVRGRC